MAAKEKFRIVVSEEDHDVILSICDTPNSLSDPKDQNGFSFNVKEDRLIISVYRCRNSFSSFEVALKTTSLDEEKLLALNALFRKCILEFQYDSDKNEIVISLPEEYTHTKEVQLDNSNENQEKISCIIALRKPFPMLKHIVSLLKLNKNKKSFNNKSAYSFYFSNRKKYCYKRKSSCASLRKHEFTCFL